MPLGKKGEAGSFMTGKTANLLLALISLVVLGGVLMALFGGGDFFQEITCKITVYFSDQVNSATLNVFPTICYTGDKVSSATTKDEVLWDLAEHMRKCWSMWGEGDLNPEGTNWVDDEFKCFKCYRIGFPDYDNSVQDNKISAEDIKDFLEDPENNVKGSKELFMKYFDNNVVLNFKGEDYQKKDLIHSDKKYALTFVEEVESNKWTRYPLRIVEGATAAGAICLAVPGVGWAAGPGCVVVGGAAFGGYTLLEDGLEELMDWYNEVPDNDAIMVSEYDSTGYCGGGYLS
jgi:hypothetical protein